MYKKQRNPLGENRINRLPHHVLANIFVFAEARFKSYGARTPPHFLAAVCHLWREVVLSIPEFWRRVSFSSSVERLSTYLSRSQQAPVDVSIDIEWGILTDQELDQALSLLHDHWFHLRSLRVLPRDSGYTGRILGALNSAIQAHPNCILEEIYIKLGPHGDDDEVYSPHPEDTPYILLPNSQMLRSIELRGLNLYPIHHHRYDTLLAPCKLILTQSSVRFLCNGLLALLSLMPNLTAIWIIGFNRSHEDEETPDAIDTSTMPSILLPNLEYLSLVDLHGEVVNHLLGELDMPNLQSFGLHTDLIFYMEAEMDWDVISRNCRLRSLSFRGLPPVQADAIVSWLKRPDDLEKLEIYPSMMGDELEFTKLIAMQLIKTAYCPKFKSFYLHFMPSGFLWKYLRALEVTRPSMLLDILA